MPIELKPSARLGSQGIKRPSWRANRLNHKRFSSTHGLTHRRSSVECRHTDAGWSSLVARRAHNPKVVGSNPAPATKHQERLLERVAFFVRACFVVSGLAPSRVAKPPQTRRPGLSGARRCLCWGGFATRRGASPLTTTSPLNTKTFSNLKLRLPEQQFHTYLTDTSING